MKKPNKVIASILAVTTLTGTSAFVVNAVNSSNNIDSSIPSIEWDASYYVDNYKGIPVNKVHCIANIDDNGEVEVNVSVNNDTNAKNMILKSTIPYSINSKEMSFSKYNTFSNDKFSFVSNDSMWNVIDVSYYDDAIYNTPEYYYEGWTNGTANSPFTYTQYIVNNSSGLSGAPSIETAGAWVSNGNYDTRTITVKFIPKTEITKPTTIHIFEHDITINPNSQVEELKNRIAELEAENKTISNELNAIKANNFDVDFNGQVDACDASLVLSAYAHNSTIYGSDKPVRSMDDFNKYMSN